MMCDDDKCKGLLFLIVGILSLQVVLSGLILFYVVGQQGGITLGVPVVNAAQQGQDRTAVLVRQVSHGESPFLGSPDAPITIVVFADYQCPYCNTLHPIMKQLLAQYEGKVRLAYRHYPLMSHEYAVHAALAAEAAGKQGHSGRCMIFATRRSAPRVRVPSFPPSS